MRIFGFRQCINAALLAQGLLCAACSAAAPAPAYEVLFAGEFQPERGAVAAEIRVTQSGGEVIRFDFNAPAAHYSNFQGDGQVSRQGDRVLWEVPEAGGSLRYRVQVDRRRGKRFDARMTADWALLRLDDLFPAARTTSAGGARSRSSLQLSGPPSWAVESRYGPLVGRTLRFTDPDRRFDRPTGWLLAGRLGIRRDEIVDRAVAVAAPVGTSYPRLPTLAFLRWTLPTMVEIFPQFPDRLLIVSATDDMWRGALSGPGSLYLHGDRPLISENGTSTLLHELVHVATGISGEAGDDWIVEGLAEYYGLQILHRSGGLSDDRLARAYDHLRAWADADDGQLADPSTGADTARAVLLFRALADELAKADTSLDALVQRLLEMGAKVSRQNLREAAATVLGRPSRVLEAALAGS